MTKTADTISYVADLIRNEHECMKSGNTEMAAHFNFMKLGVVHVATIALGCSDLYIYEQAIGQPKADGFKFYMED